MRATRSLNALALSRCTGDPSLLMVNVVEFPKPRCMPRTQINKFRDGE
jgi:hypothetical protein